MLGFLSHETQLFHSHFPLPSAHQLPVSTADEIQKLHRLRQEGVLSDEEYVRAKQKALEEGSSVGARIDKAVGNAIQDVPQYCMLMHLSQLLGFVLPIIGFVVPVLMWMLRKDDSPDIDRHGKNVVNWIISELIYGVVCAVLTMILIGIPLAGALFVCSVAFPIIAAIKAKEGIIWTYPLTIPFFK